MFYFKILVQLIPFLFSLVKSAEVAFDKEKSGPDKKKAVKEGITAMFEGASEVSTGGQKDVFTEVKPLFELVIDKGIDLAASMLFKK